MNELGMNVNVAWRVFMCLCFLYAFFFFLFCLLLLLFVSFLCYYYDSWSLPYFILFALSSQSVHLISLWLESICKDLRDTTTTNRADRHDEWLTHEWRRRFYPTLAIVARVYLILFTNSSISRDRDSGSNDKANR